MLYLLGSHVVDDFDDAISTEIRQISQPKIAPLFERFKVMVGPCRVITNRVIGFDLMLQSHVLRIFTKKLHPYKSDTVFFTRVARVVVLHVSG